MRWVSVSVNTMTQQTWQWHVCLHCLLYSASGIKSLQLASFVAYFQLTYNLMNPNNSQQQTSELAAETAWSLSFSVQNESPVSVWLEHKRFIRFS